MFCAFPEAPLDGDWALETHTDGFIIWGRDNPLLNHMLSLQSLLIVTVQHVLVVIIIGLSLMASGMLPLQSSVCMFPCSPLLT